MRMLHSTSVPPVEPRADIAHALRSVSAAQLRAWVESIAQPRHHWAESERNRATGDWLAATFESFGLRVERQGEYANIIGQAQSADVILVGAHYDSVPGSPGADDNASALVAMLGCAAICGSWERALPVVFVAFNREEDDLLGSRDFVRSYLPSAPFRVRCAHILEMVGFARSEAGSQRVPTGLPIELRSTGDFLGLLADARSGTVMEQVVKTAGGYVPELLATGLEVGVGFEKLFPVLGRSDHVPFWEAGVPAVMWTDTAEFRNPNYHRATDTAETLNYEFLAQVTRTLVATVIASARELLLSC